jgi:carboxy-cis,cis-muconate cyclase
MPKLWVSRSLQIYTQANYLTGPDPGNSLFESQIFVMAASQAPYSVYSCEWGTTTSFVAVIQVSTNGSIASLGQSLEYASGSGVHGLALSPDQRYLYSADDPGNAVWTHQVKADGTLAYVGKLTAPSNGSDPRHVDVHPSGNYLYVVLEKTNQVAIYSIDPQTRLPSASSQLVPVIPSGNVILESRR